MPTQCNPELFDFARAEGRPVVASFDGGAITSEAGALLLGATDRVLGLTRRLAACFKDSRDPAYTEHALETLVMQRVVGIALGYEDLNDHDQLRHDPVLAAPDLTISVGPLPPTTLRDLRGKRVVLLVLYELPGSRTRMIDLAKHYGALSVLGVEVVAVPPRSSQEAIAELGQSPPVLFPVVTDGNEEIAAAYRLFAPGAAHAELLIDRQGYIRAIWRSDQTGMPEADAVQAQVERLNEEKSPPPLPDDHVH